MSSSWVEYVKKYAADNNLSYKESMKAAAASYKESKKPVANVDKLIEEVKAAKPKPKSNPKQNIDINIDKLIEEVKTAKPKKTRAVLPNMSKLKVKQAAVV